MYLRSSESEDHIGLEVMICQGPTSFSTTNARVPHR